MSAAVIDDGIPNGWSLDLDPTARRIDGGQVLIGGSPLRMLRFSAAGARWLDNVVAGRPLPASSKSRLLGRRLVDAGLANPRPLAGDGLSRADVALVVAVRDAPGGLALTLATVGDVGEVVVVDDSSRDATAVTRAATGAAVLRNERSLGPGAARERGWRATTRPVVAFVDVDIDADVAAGGDWLAPLLAHLADPAVGAVAPRVTAHPGSAPKWLAGYELVRSPLDLGPAAGPVRPGSRVSYVPTAALLVRRDALESVDGFDTRLRVGEDVDLVWRLHNQGWRVRYEPAVSMRHPSRPTFGSWVRQRFDYGTSAAPLAHRHGKAVAPLGISGWSALAWAAVLFGRPLLGVGVGAATTAALVPKLRSVQHPAREALEIAGKGNLWAGRYVADALRRPWWPLAAAAAVGCRRTRPALLAAVVVPPLIEWRESRPRLDPVRFALLRLIDDVAYGTGVWFGCLRARSAQGLLPSFSGPLSAPEPAEP